MSTVDWAALSRLVPELAVVAVFVWFNLENNKQWRDFLRDQQEQTVEALKSLTEEVKAMNSVLLRHDAASARHESSSARSFHDEPKD